MKRAVSILLMLMIFLYMMNLPAYSETLKLPSMLKTIEDEAFVNDAGLDVIIFPEGLQSIGKRAFANTSLKKIYLPDSVISIANDAFEMCNSLIVSTKINTYGYYWAQERGYTIEPIKTDDSSEDGEYVLDIYWVGNGDNETVRTGVEKAISDYIKPLIGAGVRIHIIGWGDWNDKAIAALQAGEKMDLIFTADWEGYTQEALAGLLTPLDELLDQYGTGIKETLPQTYLDGAKIDKIQYAIPTNKELCLPQGFIINKTAANAIGWDVQADDPSIKSTADLEPWLKKYKQLFPNKYPYLMDGQSARWADEPWVPDFAGMGSNSISMKMAKGEDGTIDETIYSIFETPEQEEHIRLMYDWGQKGYISPDAALTSFDYNGFFGRGDFLAFAQPLKGNGIKAAEMYAANATAEFECVEITMQPKYVVTTHTSGSMFAIPVTSHSPDIAMKYLNLMHTDATLVNLMVYGLEGVNYIKVNDKQVELTDQNWYGVHGGAWTVGDTSLQYTLSTEDPQKNTLLQDFAKDAIATISLGFRFIKDAVADQIAAVDAVVSEMANPLMSGQVNPDDGTLGVEALKKALTNAGMPEILMEVKQQYWNWRQKQ